jgi:hypothetical protein
MGRFFRVTGYILGMSLIFVAILLVTTLILSSILAYFQGHELASPETLYTGLTCGLIIWLFVATFHLGKDTLYVPVPHPENFMEGARQIMIDLGYEVVFQAADQMLTRPKFHSYLFGGCILIKLDGPLAKITGPKVLAELVHKRLRLQKHIERIQQTISDKRSRPGGRLLKRVQISVKIKPEQLAEVHRHVIQPLAQEGKVVCMLTVLAQSENGIRELTPDCPIRTWLDQQGLRAEFHRDHVELSEPLQITPASKIEETMVIQELIS